MKITCNAKELAQALKNTVQYKSLPITQCVYLDTKDGRLRIRSTDLDTEIRVIIPAVVIEDGECAIPIKGLATAIKPLKGEVTISCDDNLAIISQGTMKIKIDGLLPEDFPLSTIGHDCKHLFTIPTSQLAEMIDTVGTFVAINDPRRVLNGVNVASGDGKVAFAATDGLQLQYAEVAAKMYVDFSIIIYPIVLKLVKALKGDTVSVWAKEVEEEKEIDTVYFSTDKGDVIATRAIQGMYPKYKDFLPLLVGKDIHSMEIPAKRLITICEQLEGHHTAGFLILSMEAGSKELILSSEKGSDLMVGDNPCPVNFSSIYSSASLKKVAKSLGIIGITSQRVSFVPCKGVMAIGFTTISNGISSYYLVFPVKVP